MPCNDCSCATASTTSNCKYCKYPTQTKPVTAAALLMALLSNVSTEPVEMIAVAGEHFVKPGHAKLLSGLQRSGVSAIGVSGAPIRASNQGRLLVKLLDKRSGKVFTMDLGLGHTLPDLPVSLLSVSKLVPTGSSFYFSMEESWMKLPNGGAKIMLERRDGLFFLPVYRGLQDGCQGGAGPGVSINCHSRLVGFG